MLVYKLLKSERGEIFGAQRITEHEICSFPFYDGNSDYELYKSWLEQGNTPLPADE